MAIFGKTSRAKLDTVDRDMQVVMEEAIRYFDFTILFGLRTAAEQFELYKKGRVEVGDAWVISDKGSVVTYRDGYVKKSNHQSGRAVDIAPYYKDSPHIRWKDTEMFDRLSVVVKECARRLKEEGLITADLTWGGDWRSFVDLPHFELKG